MGTFAVVPGHLFARVSPLISCGLKLTRATIEVRRSFFSGPSLSELKTSPKKTDLEKIQTATGSRIPWPRYTQQHAKIKGAYFPTILGQGVRHSETFSREKWYLYRTNASVLACVVVILRYEPAKEAILGHAAQNNFPERFTQ